MTAEVFVGTSEAFKQRLSANKRVRAAGPGEFLAFSEAIEQLVQRMWGNLPRPSALAEFKKVHARGGLAGVGRGPIGYGPWRDAAAAALTFAAKRGKLIVWLVCEPSRACTSHDAGHDGLTELPLEVVKRLVAPRGGLPDRAIRPTLATTCGDEKLLRPLTTGILAVRKGDFMVWCRAERAKGRWASQRSRLKPRIGRPSKQTESLRDEILSRADDGRWHPEQPIARLRRMLIDDGVPGVPSADTLGRFVDDLVVETGDTRLLRKKRPRRKHRRSPETPYRKTPV